MARALGTLPTGRVSVSKHGHAPYRSRLRFKTWARSLRVAFPFQNMGSLPTGRVSVLKHGHAPYRSRLRFKTWARSLQVASPLVSTNRPGRGHLTDLAPLKPTAGASNFTPWRHYFSPQNPDHHRPQPTTTDHLRLHHPGRRRPACFKSSVDQGRAPHPDRRA